MNNFAKKASKSERFNVKIHQNEKTDQAPKANSLPNPEIWKKQPAIHDKTVFLSSSSTSVWSEHEMILMILFLVSYSKLIIVVYY